MTKNAYYPATSPTQRMHMFFCILSILVSAATHVAFATGESSPTAVIRPTSLITWENSNFATDLTMGGSYVAVGSFQKSSNRAGTVMLYQMTGNTLTYDTTISHLGTNPSNGFPANRQFGDSVSLSADGLELFVGAPGDAGPEYGAAFIYRKDPVNGWTFHQKLSSPDSQTEDLDNFGSTVRVSGDHLAVAATRTNIPHFDCGSIYMYHRQSDGTWEFTNELQAPDARENDLLGDVLYIQGDTLVAAAIGADIAGNDNQGAVYIFKWNNITDQWDFATRLTAPDGSPNDFFGSAIAINSSGNRLAIAARGRDTPHNGSFIFDQGAVYMFQPHPNKHWECTSILKNTDRANGDWFGRSLTFQGDLLYVGASRKLGSNDDVMGAAYAFKNNSHGIADNWRQIHKFTPTGTDAYSWFGDKILASSTHLIIGARLDSTINWKDGAIHLFDPSFNKVPATHLYDTWLQSHFPAATLANPALRQSIWGPQADPDQDDTPNLAEAYVGNTPLISENTSLQLWSWDNLTLTWTIQPHHMPTGVTAYLQSSIDLNHWQRCQSANYTEGTFTVPPSSSSRSHYRLTFEIE